MAPNEIVELSEHTKEINDFLEKVLAAGELHVRFRGEVFAVQMTRLSASKKGRDFLAKGRPIID